MACLCAPTSHEGSFRCRLHRGLHLPPNHSPSIANHQIRGFNYCNSCCSINPLSNQPCCNPHFTVRELPSASTASASTSPHPFDDRRRFSHTPHLAAAEYHQSIVHTRSLTPTACPSSSYTLPSTSPWSSSSLCRLSSFSPSSFYTSSSSSSSRASSSSSSPSPSSPCCCTRPPPAGKRTSPSSSSPSKYVYYRVSSPSSSLCGANGTTPSASTTPSPSHAAALAIMKHKHGARSHNRNILSPTSAFKIGPSRLSRMAVACADERPLLKDEQCISNAPRHGNAPDTFSGSRTETAAPREFASYKAEPSIGLKTRSAVKKFKQSESSCRIVGSKGGSLIMPTVY